MLVFKKFSMAYKLWYQSFSLIILYIYTTISVAEEEEKIPGLFRRTPEDDLPSTLGLRASLPPAWLDPNSRRQR